MIRTIVVDDDFLVRSYLKQLQAWNRAGCELIADLRDGEEALRVIEETGPDLIVTDISMPLIDGIELIRKIREKNQAVYIIVLSCHDDFEYVKEAMKLGADEYVLKNSLNEENLYNILENTKKQLEKRKEKYQNKDQENRLMEMGRNTLKYYYFNGLLSGSFSMREREEKRILAGIRASYMNSAVVSIFISNWGIVKKEHTELELEHYCQQFLVKVMLELSESEEGTEHTECVYLGEGVFCSFVDLSDLRRIVAMRQRLMSIAAACFRCCRQESYEYGVGVSGICFGAEGIRQAYQQVRETMKLSFYEKGNILYYEENQLLGKTLPKEANQLLYQVKQLVEREDYRSIEQQLAQVIDSFCMEHTDMRLVLHWVKEMDEELGVERVREAYAQIVRIEQISLICEDYRQKIFHCRGDVIPEELSPSIRLAIDFLHKHYKEPIGLTQAAEAAGLNSAYFSFLFKREMNRGFSEYLLSLRMAHAERLLLTTNEKVKDIAIHSGFGDYHYFSKVFKKGHGTNPADYRKEKK